MPEAIVSNTQDQQYTISDNGKNVRPVLVSNSHFFIQSSGENSFQQQENFGVISESQFRTTAKVNHTGAVYAICQGQVFVQPQTGNPNKVNVILRPYKQPIRELPIKYFIYRGLKKSDFISGTGDEALVAGSETSGSGFVQHIWGEFNKFYSHLSVDEKPPFKASMIGFSDDATLSLDKLMDEYFYKISVYDDDDQQDESETTQFELPLIPRGIHLSSNVEATEIGLDIVLNKGDYYIENDTNPFKFDLAFARLAEHILDTNTITGSAPEDVYKKKLIKEACTQFMDVAAFYGLHCNGLGKLFVNDVEAPLTSKGTIYQHVKNFNTAHTQYLYIQSNRQRSYNFYNNYTHPVSSLSLKEGADPTSLSETTFGTQGWPVHVIDNQQNTYIQLITDNYDGAALYTKLGRLITEHEQNFVRNTNLLQQPSNDTNNPVDVNYTKPIGFKAIVENTNAIADYIQLIYEGKQLIATDATNPDQQYILKDIDDVFGLIDAQSFIKTKPNVVELSSVLEEELQLINFPNTQTGKDIGVVKTKRIADTIQISEEENLTRITYETLLFNIKNNNSSYSQGNSSSIDKSTAGTHSFSAQQNNFYQPTLPYYFKTQLLTDSNQTITGLLLETLDGSTPTKKILGITNDENQILKDLITQNGLNNCKVFFKELENFNKNEIKKH